MKRAGVIVFCFLAQLTFGQWQKVFTAPTIASSGFFQNEREGCIGTGHYEAGGPAQIYFTTNGGATWTVAALPNSRLTGQVTDVWFRDKLNGWATVKNEPETGWSGAYRTNDGGRTWQFTSQLFYPVTIRETPRGIFVMDRVTGILRSIDQGRTFTTIEQYSGALGLDFLDGNNGIASGESMANSPIMITLDGGVTWVAKVFDREAWTTFADPVAGRMYYASERDQKFPAAESTVGVTNDNGATFSNPKTWIGNSLTGGIAGSKKCKSVVYVQGQDLPASPVKGMLRTTDNGQNWVAVGGPASINDTRFAVTGRGAVVYAFDRFGGVWKTTSGGDGAITSSVRTATLIQAPANTFSAKLCDSVTIRIPIRFTGCEEIRITSITFDSELSLVSAPQVLLATAAKYDTIVLRYHPKVAGATNKPVVISYVQSDGAPEDTTIFVNVNGIAIPDIPQITTPSGGRSAAYGDISVCGGDSSDIIAITNGGCAPMRVTDLRVSGIAFTLLSSFKPFTLDPGTSRKFLVQFKPQLVTSYSGAVMVVTTNGADSIPLTGAGIQGARALRLVVPVMEATLCDTPEYILILRNISCTDVTLDSLGLDAPFELLTASEGVSLATDSMLVLRVRLVPKAAGTFTEDLRIYSRSKGERFDTTITITAIISRGEAALSLMADTIDFGDISTCSFAEASLAIANLGCDTLHVTITPPGASDFTLTGASGFDLARDSAAALTVTFKPTQLGLETSSIVITSNGGSRQVVLRGRGTSGSGSVQGIADVLGEVLTCKDTSFAIRLTSAACDTIFFDSLVTSGAGASDYFIPTSGLTMLAVGESTVLAGTFAPQASGDRQLTVTFYFHTRLGTSYSAIVTLSGIGATPPVIVLAIPAAPFAIEASKAFSLPVELQGATGLPVNTLTFTAQTHTDFVALTGFALRPQYASAILDTVVRDDSVWARIQFTPPTILQAGALGDLYAATYLSDTLEAEVMLTGFTIADSAGSSPCLPNSYDSAAIHIALDPRCGDLIISQYMRGRLDLVSIESVVPNPASDAVKVKLRYPKAYSGSCVVDVIDAVGRTVFRRAAEGSTMGIILDEPSGMYQLRVISSGGIVSSNLIISR